MRHFVAGFQDELEKTAIVGKALGFLMKHPLIGLGAATTAVGGAAAGLSGFREGMKGERPRYLQASKHGPSDAFYTNYHEALPHDAEPGERRQMSYNYNPRAFGEK